MSLPARLSDIFAKLPTPTTRASDDGPPWISDEYTRTLEDWEYRRWGLPERLPATLLGLLRLADFVEEAIDLIQPSVVLTTNKIDHGVTLFREASLHRGLTTKVVERSPLDSIWLEPHGLFGESVIGSKYSESSSSQSTRTIELGKSYVAKVAENPHGFRAATGPQSLPRWLRDLPKPIFFLPMDNVLWTGWEQESHPMREVDNPLYASPREAMAELLEHAQALGGSLLVKRHPACLAIHPGSLPPGAHWVEGDLNALLELADVVVTFNTKVAFPALALGRPVVTLAPNPVAACGATYHCLDRSQVRQTLQAALARNDLGSKLKRFPPFAGWLADDFFYDCLEKPEPHHRGPRRFVEDLISRAGVVEESFDDAQLEAMARDLRKLAAVPPKPSSPIQQPQGATHAPVAGESPKVAASVADSLPSKALRTLRQEGFRELTRKTMLWALPHLGKRTLAAGAATLERLGIRTDELKAKQPYLVQYRRQWLPARAVPYGELFQRLWLSGLFSDSPLAPTGCNDQEITKLGELRGRYAGQPVIILGNSRPVKSSGAGTELTFCVDDHFDDRVDDRFGEAQEREPNFYTTLDPHRATKAKQHLKASRKTLFFLPQALYGLVPPNPRLFWFGMQPASSQPSAASLVERGFSATDSASELAAELASYLGCVLVPSESGEQRNPSNSTAGQR